MKKLFITRRDMFLFLIMIIFAPLVMKMLHVESLLFRRTGTSNFGTIQVFINDAIILAAILLLFYLSYWRKTPLITSILLRGLGLFIIFLYVLDLYLIKNFSNHLIWTDALKYSSYAVKYFQQVNSGKGAVMIFGLIVVAAFVYRVLTSEYRIKNKSSHKYPIAVIIGLIIASSFAGANNEKYLHSWIYRNFVDYNLMLLSEAKVYSDEFIADFDYSEPSQCYAKEVEKKNVIILMVESLSAYHSDAFSGLNDWTPNIDAIAEKNIAYTDFYANGFITEDAEIAMLTGLLPIYPPSNKVVKSGGRYSRGGGRSFNGFFDIEESLPNILSKEGYTTDFLTTADLEFAKTGEWTDSIGFDYIEGHEHPYYDNFQRRHFMSAPDEALYDRVLDRVDHHSSGTDNYLIFIKTVSTHHPFINPETSERSQQQAVQYADKHIGLLYKELMEQNYFDDGILMIVGDHRTMTPLTKAEIDRFGADRAPSKVPMILSYGDKKSEQVTGQYQQTDIFNMIKGMVSDEQCYSDWLGDMQGNTPAKFIAHRRGDNRNHISIYSGENDYKVMLDGDDTHLLDSDKVNEEDKQIMINKINAARILEN